jgi:hypothetical protein
MTAVVALVHFGGSRKVLTIALCDQCDHFKKLSSKVPAEYHIQSKVSINQFHLFVDALEGHPIKLVPSDCEALGLLCEEFGFVTLAANVAKVLHEGTQSRISDLINMITQEQRSLMRWLDGLNSGLNMIEQNSQLPIATKWKLLSETHENFQTRSIDSLLSFVQTLDTMVKEAQSQGIIKNEEVMVSIQEMVDDVKEQNLVVKQHIAGTWLVLQHGNRFQNVESIPTLETLMKLLKSSKPTQSSAPPDYLIIECHFKDGTIQDANPWIFKRLLSQAVTLPVDSMISIEFSVGSLVAKSLWQFDVNFKQVSDFPNSETGKWVVDDVSTVKCTGEIEGLIKQIKENSKWLSLNEPDDEFDFLLSKPGISPENIVKAPIRDFRIADEFLTEAMEKSVLDLELVSINFYGNTRFYDQFRQTLTNSKAKYLFHGSPGNLKDFIGDGFDEKKKGKLGQLFGNGFYLTSFLDYALCYQYQTRPFTGDAVRTKIVPKIEKNNGSFNILLMLCNLGNCRTITGPHNKKELPEGCDSHYTLVQGGGPAHNPPRPDFPVYDEFVVKNKYAIFPQFIVTLRLRQPGRLLVWRNTSFIQCNNRPFFAQLKAQFKELPIFAYDCDDDALARIQKTRHRTQLFVMSNRADDGKRFIAKCRELGVQTPIQVFCAYVRDWIPMEGVTISNVKADVLNFVKNVILKS